MMDMKQKSRRNQNGQELISTKVSEFSHNTAGSEAAKFSAFKKLVSLELRPFAHVCQNSLTPSPPHLLQSKFPILGLFFFSIWNKPVSQIFVWFGSI